MSKHKSGAFGSRKGIAQPAVRVQGNNLQFSSDPAPWFADFDRLGLEASALTTSAGMVLTFVTDQELLKLVNRVTLNDDLLVLNSHVAALKGRLEILKGETNELRAKVKKINLDSVQLLLNHGEALSDFMNDWTRIAMFSVDTVLEHFRKVGVDIPYLCPFSPGFEKPVGSNQMTATQFAEATAPVSAATLMQEGK